MNKYNEVMKRVKNKESIKAVHYVKLEHDSDKCRARIMSGNGTKLCRDFFERKSEYFFNGSTLFILIASFPHGIWETVLVLPICI